MRELFWKGKSLAEHFQHTFGTKKKKKKSLNSLERVREIDFTYVTSPPRWHRRDLLGPWFLPQGNWECVSECSGFPVMQEAAKRGLLLSCPLPRTDSWATLLQTGKKLREQQMRLLEGTKGNQILLCHRLHQEVHPKALGILSLQDLTVSPWAPEHSMYPQPRGWLPECTPYGGDTEFWRCLVSTWKSWSKSAGQGEISNFSFVSALGKAREKLSAPGWVHGKTDKKAYKI